MTRQPVRKVRVQGRAARAAWGNLARPAGRGATASDPLPRWDPFLALLAAHGLPAPETEVVGLVPDRQFRVDYYWRAAQVVVEQDGGVWWHTGGHSTGSGILRDMEKANLLQLEGLIVLRFTPQQLQMQATIDLLRRLVGSPADVLAAFGVKG